MAYAQPALLCLLLALLASGVLAFQGFASLSQQGYYKYLPVFTPDRGLRDVIAVASFSVNVGQPIYIPQSLVCGTSTEYCSKPVFAPCCANCSLPPVERKPRKCFCPVNPDAQCIDSSPPISQRSADANGSYAFEFGFLAGARCASYAIHVNSAVGTPGTVNFMVDGAPLYLPYTACPTPDNPSNPIPSYGRIVPQGLLSRLPQLRQPYALEIILLEGPAAHFLPVRFFYQLLPPMPFRCGDVSMDVPQWSYPSTDTTEAYIVASWPTFTLDLVSWRNDTLSFIVIVWIYSENEFHFSSGLPVDLDPTTCQVDISGLVMAEGTPIPNATATFAHAPPLPCTHAALQNTLARTAMLSEMILPAHEEGLVGNGDSFLFGLSFTDASAEYASCFNFVNEELGDVTTTDLFVENSRSCFYAPTDPQYASDPCCNIALTLHMCCGPRNLTVTTPLSTPNPDYVAHKCRTPRCVSEALESIHSSTLNSPICRTNLADLLFSGEASALGKTCPEDDFANFVSFGFKALACNSDGECLSGDCSSDPYRLNGFYITEHIPLFQKVCRRTNDPAKALGCLIANLSLPIRNVMAGSVDAPSSISDADLVARLAALYTAEMLEPGNAPELAEYCPWAVSGTEKTLGLGHCPLGNKFLSDYFCAAGNCTAGQPCIEVSRVSGCFGNYTSFGAYTDFACINAGGQNLYVVFPGKSDWHITCVYPDLTSTKLCFPADKCQTSRLVEDPETARTYCPPYCIVPITTDANCTCDNLEVPGACGPEGLVWSAESNTCEMRSTSYFSLMEACEVVNGNFWHGTLWQEEFLLEQASCENLGLCTADAAGFARTVAAQYGITDAMYTHAECEAMMGCDLGTHNTNQTDCESHGVCSDALLYGHCQHEAYVALPAPRCPEFAVVAPTVPGIACISAEYVCPQTIPDDFPDTEAQCDTSNYCENARTPLLLARNSSECARCGGVPHPRATWTNAQWHQGTWSGFRWMPRNATKYPAPNFIMELLIKDIGQAYKGIFYSAMLQSRLCAHDTTLAALPALVCDCVDKEDGCFNKPMELPSGVFYACSNVPLTEMGANYAFIVTDSGQPLDRDTDPISCRTVSISRVPLSAFKAEVETPFSSFFLAAVRLNPYTVLRNDNSAPVGQLRGDIIRVTFAGRVYTAKNEVLGASLCLNFASGPPRVAHLNTPAIVRWSPDDPNLFLPMTDGLTIENGSMCINLTESGYYAALLIASNWETRTQVSVLPTSTVAVFAAASVLYGVLFAICVVRLLGVFVSASAEQRITIASFVMLAIFLFLRTILFILLRTGVFAVLDDSPLRLFFLAEFPTHLEFSLAVLVLYVWATLYHGMEGKKQHFRKPIICCCIAANVLFYVLFFGVLIARSRLEKTTQGTQGAECARPPGTPPLIILDRFYKTVVALFALALAACVAIYGAMHMQRVHSLLHGVAYAQVISVILLTLVGLVLQAILVLYIAFRPGNLAVVVAGAAAELVRPAAMLLVLRSVDFKCCGDKKKTEELISDRVDASSAYTALEDDGSDF